MDRRLSLWMLSLFLLVNLSSAEAADVAWHRDVDEAWQESVRDNRPLLVFLTSSHCRYCSQMKEQTFRDQAVAEYLDQSYVAVSVDARKVAWLVKQMKVSGYPTTLIISPEAEVLAQLKGFVPPDKLLPKLQQAAPAGRIASRPTKKAS